jgi:putative restriction endonuclease
MPQQPANALEDAVLNAFARSGGSGRLLSPSGQNPRRFTLRYGGRTFNVWAYLWTLTLGGRRLRGEYRVQLTGVYPPLRTNRSGPTLILGYEPELDMFGGFDIRRHRTFTAGSPSVQINVSALKMARASGLQFVKKSNGETVAGVRPDFLLGYATNVRPLHAVAASPQASGFNSGLASGQVAPMAPAQPRKKLVSQVSRWARDGKFRAQVLKAYDFRCAVTGMQLDLVEAAHILPVEAEGSADVVSNGIALSPTYHAALDAGLIYLDERLRMRLSARKANGLRKMGLGGQLAAFKTTLGPVLVPKLKREWPDPRFIEAGNRFRRVP